MVPWTALYFSFALAENEKPHVVLAPPDFVYAPVVEHQSAGYAYVCLGDNVIGKVAVTYAQTVEQFVPPKKNFWKRLFGR